MPKGNEIITYKNRIIHDILHNEDESLSHDLVYALDPDCIGCEDELIYSNIFPYLKVPDIQTEAKCYITMAVNMLKVSPKNYFFKNMVITINVIVHDEKMKMDPQYNATRADYIAAIINKIFNGNKGYGIVPLEYVSDTESLLLNSFFMRTMRFSCDELNSVRC